MVNEKPIRGAKERVRHRIINIHEEQGYARSYINMNEPVRNQRESRRYINGAFVCIKCGEKNSRARPRPFSGIIKRTLSRLAVLTLESILVSPTYPPCG